MIAHTKQLTLCLMSGITIECVIDVREKINPYLQKLMVNSRNSNLLSVMQLLILMGG